jgi:hypothetical protein
MSVLGTLTNIYSRTLAALLATSILDSIMWTSTFGKPSYVVQGRKQIKPFEVTLRLNKGQAWLCTQIKRLIPRHKPIIFQNALRMVACI